MNVYVYVSNNPINHIDPLGLEEQNSKDEEAIEKAIEYYKAQQKRITDTWAYRLWGQGWGLVVEIELDIKRLKGELEDFKSAVNKLVARRQPHHNRVFP